jgi:hypothetical protein
MIIVSILVVVAVLGVVFFMLAARGQAIAVSGVSDLSGRTQPVDLAAFRNLVDPDEAAYLRDHLTGTQFRKIQRERLRAAATYVSCVADNAAVLLRLGEAARQSQDPQVARAGEELVDTALRVRLFALLASVKIHTGILIPTLPLSPARLSDGYERLTGMVGRLGRLQNQRVGVRVSAVL